MARRSQVPHSSAGFYAANNQFQLSGTKGFFEIKVLSKDSVFIRIDFPGVSKEKFHYTISEDKKSVFLEGEATQESANENGSRSYLFSFTFPCGCCEIVNVKSDVRDGVIRVILEKKQIRKQEDIPNVFAEVKDYVSFGAASAVYTALSANKAVHSDGSGRVIEDHPYVTKGSDKALEAKPTGDGGLFLRVDLPGVAKEDARVWAVGGDVRFCGKARKVMEHDESGRDYLGSISLLEMTPIKGKIQHEMKDGVIRMFIPPP